MTLIGRSAPSNAERLRRLRKHLANREHMRRAREARKLCCVGVDPPLEAGACGRMVRAESQRCIHCARRRWWLLNHAVNDIELAITAILEDDTAPRTSDDDPPSTFPPSSRPSTSSPTSAIPALVGEDSRARRRGAVHQRGIALGFLAPHPDLQVSTTAHEHSVRLPSPSASGTPPAAQAPDLGARRRWLEPATPRCEQCEAPGVRRRWQTFVCSEWPASLTLPPPGRR